MAGAWQAFLFLNLNTQFKTVDAFAAWLAMQPRPTWGPIGSTYHNTYIPNESQWRGEASMDAMEREYKKKDPPWDRGPHCFLAVGTVADGIWVMTSPSYEGIHAGKCNTNRFGLEVVGDFNTRPMSEAQLDLLVSVAAALHRWASIGPDINAHRDCMARTCPGNAAYFQKGEIQRRLTSALKPPPLFAPYTEDSSILGIPRTTMERVIEKVLSRSIVNPKAERPYTEADVRKVIIPAYWSQSLAVGIDPVLAIAQMLHETGNLTSFWAQRPQRNPAGIGVDGTKQPHKPDILKGWAFNYDKGVWALGLSFTDWEKESIPAQLGRLLAWALPAGQGNTAQQALILKALAFRPLPSVARGSAPMLKKLGRVRNPSGYGWASPGDDYGRKIAAKANWLMGYD